MSVTTTDAGTTVVRAYLDAVSDLDVEAITALLHPDVVMHIPYAPDGIPPKVEGKAAVVEWFSGMPNLMAPLNFANHDIVAVQREGEYIARYTGDTTVLTTGLPYRNTYISCFTVRDGLIINSTEFFDSVSLVRGLGWTVTPPAQG
jgi:hypothetical protein